MERFAASGPIEVKSPFYRVHATIAVRYYLPMVNVPYIAHDVQIGVMRRCRTQVFLDTQCLHVCPEISNFTIGHRLPYSVRGRIAERLGI